MGGQSKMTAVWKAFLVKPETEASFVNSMLKRNKKPALDK